jgi:hypothetical protein
MTIHRDPDEILAAWLDEGPSRLPEQTRRAISVALPTTSQRRRGWSVPWRSSTMSTTLKYAIGAVAVVAIAFGGWFFLAPAPGGVGAGPGPTPSPSLTVTPVAPSPSVASSPTAYSSRLFEVPIQLLLQDGFTIADDYPGGVDLSGHSEQAAIMSIASMAVRGSKPTDPWVPWPADIRAWLSSRPEFKPSAPRPITVDGRPGSVIDFEVVDPLAYSAAWIRNGPVGGIRPGDPNISGWRIHLVVIPTGNGTGIVAYAEGPPADFAQASASLDRLLTTLVFR